MENLLLCLPANLLDGGERRWIRLEKGDTPEKKRESKRGGKRRKETLLRRKGNQKGEKRRKETLLRRKENQ